jgi:hypothetical protein
MNISKKVIKSIEQTPEKNCVRNDIVFQNLQHLRYRESKNDPVTVISAVTLPAERWHLERLWLNTLDNAVRSGIIKNHPSVHIQGVEKGKDNFIESSIHVPPNCNITHGMLNEFLDNEVRYSRSGLGQIDLSTLRYNPVTMSFYWADYCMPADIEVIKDFAKRICSNMPEGIAYLTMSLRLRGKTKKFLKDFKKFGVINYAQSVENAVNYHINQNMKGIKGKKINLIYKVVYGGGEKEGTTMLTIGYSINIPKEAITVIRENRIEGKRDLKKRRKAIAWHLKHKKFKVFKPAKVKPVKTYKDMRVELAVTRWKDKWGDLSKEKKEKIASKYGLRASQFRCKVAHHHGAFLIRKNKPQAIKNLKNKRSEIIKRIQELRAA